MYFYKRKGSLKASALNQLWLNKFPREKWWEFSDDELFEGVNDKLCTSLSFLLLCEEIEGNSRHNLHLILKRD
jgi:hypothetical protein